MIVEGFLMSLDSKSGRMRKLGLEVSTEGIPNIDRARIEPEAELYQGMLYRLPERDNGKKSSIFQTKYIFNSTSKLKFSRCQAYVFPKLH